MALLKRSDIARSRNLTPQDLKELEQEGIVDPIVLEGELYYSDRQQILLDIVLKGKRLGFSLAEIKTLIRRSRRLN